MANDKFDRCRGCLNRPVTLDKNVGYCEPCRVKRDDFAKAALTGIMASNSADPMDRARIAFRFADDMMTRRLSP